MIPRPQSYEDFIVDSNAVLPRIDMYLPNDRSVGITAENIQTISFTDEICNPGSFGIGATISNKFECKICEYFPDLEKYDGSEALFYLSTPNAPESYAGRGHYIVEVSRALDGTATIIGYDYMSNPEYNDARFDGQTIGTSTTTILEAIQLLGFSPSGSFSYSGTVVGQISFTEQNGLLNATARTVLGYLCELCGCYARFSPGGYLNIERIKLPYNADGTDADPVEYTIENLTEAPECNAKLTVITGIFVEAKDGSVATTGTDGYYLTVQNNPFIKTQADATNAMDRLAQLYLNKGFYAFTATENGDPAVEAGDVVAFEVNGTTYKSVVTSFHCTIQDSCTLSCDVEEKQSVSQIVTQSGNIAFKNVGNSNVPIYIDTNGNPKAITKQVWEAGDTSGNLTLFGYGYCTTTSGTIYSFFPFSKKITASAVEILSCSGVYIRGVNGLILNNASTVAALNISNIIISENGFRILHTGLTTNWVSSTPISIVGTFKLKFT